MGLTRIAINRAVAVAENEIPAAAVRIINAE